jgi:hypothetical protein
VCSSISRNRDWSRSDNATDHTPFTSRPGPRPRPTDRSCGPEANSG